MTIGAIIGSISSSLFVNKMGPKGSFLYISIINILGCMLIYLSSNLHPEEDFKSLPQYEQSLQIVFNNRGIPEKEAEKRNNDGNEYSFSQWKNQSDVLGFSHIGFIGEKYTFPSALYLLSAGRLLNGIFVGLASAVAPQYIIEISPPSKQGVIGVLNQLLITIGILVVNIFGLESLGGKNYVLVFIIPGFISLIFAILTVFGKTFLPESPKFLYLIQNDRETAEQNMLIMRSSKDQVDLEMKILDAEQEAQKANTSDNSLSVRQLFQKIELRWQVLTLFFMHIAQPMTGINAVFFFSNEIFQNVNVAASQLVYYSIALSGLNVFMTVISAQVIERTGRKFLLLGGYVFACTSMTFLVFAMKWNLSIISLLALLGFIAGFAIGPGPIPWIYNSELFPTSARGAAGVLGCITNWGFNFIIAALFNTANKYLGPNVFFIFIVFSVMTCVYVVKVVPETKGKSANQVFNDFAERNGVAKIDEQEMVAMKGAEEL